MWQPRASCARRRRPRVPPRVPLLVLVALGALLGAPPAARAASVLGWMWGAGADSDGSMGAMRGETLMRPRTRPFRLDKCVARSHELRAGRDWAEHRTKWPENAYVLLSLPRSGSTYLATMLESHPQIAAWGEVFHNVNDNRCYQTMQPVSKDDHRDYINCFLQRHICKMGFCATGCHKSLTRGENLFAGADKCAICTKNATASVFKLLMSHVRSVPLLQAPGVVSGLKYIVLRRRDVVATTLSFVSMREQGTNHITSEHPLTLKKDKLNVNIGRLADDIATTLKQEMSMIKYAHEMASQTYTVWYEDLVTSSDRGEFTTGPWANLMRFLGVEPMPLITPLKKIHNSSATEEEDLYANRDEIKRYIQARFGANTW